MSVEPRGVGAGASGRHGRSRRPKRPRYRRVLVATEGKETERQYVESLVQTMRSGGVAVSVTTAHGDSDPVSVVKKCIQVRDDEKRKKRETFDECVCLVDVDTHAHLDEAITLAERKGIQVVVSNLKFEIWLLWHVNDSAGEMTSKQLDDLMDKRSLFQKKKHLSAKFPIENVDRAVAVARRADPDLAACRKGANPSSAMPVLVDILRGTS